MIRIWFPILILCAAPVASQTDPARTVDPTFLHRFAPEAKTVPAAISSATAHYQPLFGEGSTHAKLLRVTTRFGTLKVDPRGASARVQYPREEHILVVLKGAGSVSYGGVEHQVKANDFFYLPPGVAFGLDGGGAGVEAVLMGFRVPEKMPLVIPPALAIANINDVKLVPVGTHPMSTLYRLLMGDTKSTRDRLATGHVMISLFMMEFEPGGTNFPHHHETQEEIYLLLDGTGDMVAGSGVNGIEGKYRAEPGDAYYYRPNATVGFYNDKSGTKPARILAVRANIPLP